jgi:hypothetical protein
VPATFAVDRATRFQVLIVRIRARTWASSCSSKWAGGLGVDVVRDTAVGHQGHRLREGEGGLLRSVKKCRASRQTATMCSRSSLSPALRASFVCMWRQYAQWLRCEARIWISSTRAGSRPSRAAASKPMRARKTFGAAFAKLMRVGVRPGRSCGVRSCSSS